MKLDRVTFFISVGPVCKVLFDSISGNMLKIRFSFNMGSTVLDNIVRGVNIEFDTGSSCTVEIGKFSEISVVFRGCELLLLMDEPGIWVPTLT